MARFKQPDQARGPGQFGALLRAHRLAAARSQEELAERAGLSQRAISDLERGVRRAPYPATIRRLGQALSLSDSELAIMAAAARLSASPQSEASPERWDMVQTAREFSAGRDAQSLNQLPMQISTFIGRKRELRELKNAFRATRLLTLTGAGGVGKTRLALRLATDALPDFADGVRFVDLAPLRDSVLLTHTVLSALGQSEEPGRPVVEALLSYLSTCAVLLVLDNCEHVLAASADLVTIILQQCSGVTILATSREALHVAGERVWVVPPLELPDVAEIRDLERSAGAEAVQLYVDRASASFQDFALTADNVPAVAEICRRLDGIPLAIELAAARARFLTPQETVSHLEDRLELFTRAAGAERQHTLRALCDWSHELLSEPERALFRRLAVFAGGWTLDAAEALCAPKLDGTASVRRLLSLLVDKSMVQAHQQGEGTRYSFHETLRQFALDKLRAVAEEMEFRERHLQWCLDVAERVDRDLRGPATSQGLDELGREHDNLRAALSWGQESRHFDQALTLAGSLGWYWWAREHSREGCRWLEGLLERSYSTVIADHTRTLLTAQVKALSALGLLWVRRADLRAARPVVERALSGARSLHASALEGWPLLLLGQIELGEDRLDRAKRLFEEGLAQCAPGSSPRDYQFLSWLGHVAAAASRLEEAEALYEHQLELAHGQGDGFFEAVALSNLGELAVRQGQASLAHSRLQRSIVLMSELATGDMPAVLSHFVELAVLEGSFVRALRLGGAVEALLAARSATLQPRQSCQLASQLEVAGERVSEHVAAKALAEGRRMSLREAVAYASSA
jgi:predicted ATPase/DNA-binding XRE family transcriptional regulator